MATKINITLDGGGTAGELEAKVLKYAKETLSYPEGETTPPIAWIIEKKTLIDIIEYCANCDMAMQTAQDKENLSITVTEETV